MNNRLNTKERLLRVMNLTDGMCVLCGKCLESSQHLFFECSVSKCCMDGVKIWLKMRMKTIELGKQVRWLQRAKVSIFQKEIWTSAIAATIYNIWRQRNNILWHGDSVNTGQIIGKVKKDVYNSVYLCNRFKVSKKHMEWFEACN